MGRECLEILDYTDNQGNVEIKNFEENIEVTTHTPEWIPIGEDGEQFENHIIEEDRTSNFMAVVAKIKNDPNKQGNTYIRKIKLELTDHFLAPKGVPYRFSLPEGEPDEPDEEGVQEEEKTQNRQEDAPRPLKKGQAPKKKSKLNPFIFVRKLVSQKKVRFAMKNWDLDLTYITNRIIAWGFPATGITSTYRNSKPELIDFF